MTHRAAYDLLLKRLRARGWSVRHRKMGANDWGAIYHEDKRIVIASDIAVKEKLVTLAHECGHAEQLRVKKWRRFMDSRGLPDTPANRRYVEAAEVDASRRAKRLLEKMGVTDVAFVELDEKELPRLRKLWYDEYLR